VTATDVAPDDQRFRSDDLFYRYIHPKLADEQG
jgi:hypothetical protein